MDTLRESCEPLVLVSYLPGEGVLPSDYRTVCILCVTDLSYSRGIAAHWAHPGPIINVEHDLAWSDAHIAELLACKYSVCSWAYPLHWQSSGHAEDVYAHKVNGLPVEYGAEWADWSAPGFMKIAPEARTGRMVECHWRRVEDAVNATVTGPIHLHWPPVEHWHY